MSSRIRREESQQQTRQRLLDAAFTVFSRKGYHAASLEAIAEEAGFSKGAVYSNFANKEELFLSLLDHYMEEQMKRWDKVKLILTPELESEIPRPASQEEVETTYVEHIQQQRLWIMLQLEFIIHALRDETMRPEVASRLRTMRQVMQGHIAAAHAAQGTSPTLPMADLSLYMFSFDMGLALQTLLDPEVIPENGYTLAMQRLLS